MCLVNTFSLGLVRKSFLLLEGKEVSLSTYTEAGRTAVPPPRVPAAGVADRCLCCRFINNMEVSYHGVYTQTAPFVLEKLCEDTVYEIYVQAVNKHGTGDPSSRVLFRTLKPVPEKKMEDDSAYNVTECCTSVQISPGCMPLCDYNARMSHVRMLAATCASELSSLVRCAAGGRNHQPCCQRRGVPDSCMSLCAGSFSNQATPAVCMPYIGNIMMCLEEGKTVLP